MQLLHSLLKARGCCAGSLPDHVQQAALPRPEQTPLSWHAHPVHVWCVVLHRRCHLNPHLHHHSSHHHLVWHLPHRGVLVDGTGPHHLLRRPQPGALLRALLQAH